MNSTSGRYGFRTAFVKALIAASCVALVLLFNGCKLEPKRVDSIDMPSSEPIEMGEVEHVESGFAALLTEQDDESGANDSEPGTNSTGNQPEDDSWKNDKPRDGESCAIYAQRVQPKLKVGRRRRRGVQLH